MRIKTIFIIIITVLLTVVIMQNTKAVPFNFLFSTFYVSQMVMLIAVAVVGFIVGLIVGRPARAKYMPVKDPEIETKNNKPDTLSQQDRDYIS